MGGIGIPLDRRRALDAAASQCQTKLRSGCTISSQNMIMPIMPPETTISQYAKGPPYDPNGRRCTSARCNTGTLQTTAALSRNYTNLTAKAPLGGVDRYSMPAFIALQALSTAP